jgi:hypothetical protein
MLGERIIHQMLWRNNDRSIWPGSGRNIGGICLFFYDNNQKTGPGIDGDLVQAFVISFLRFSKRSWPDFSVHIKLFM